MVKNNETTEKRRPEKFSVILFVLVVGSLLIRCSSEFPVEHDLSRKAFHLIDQDSHSVVFPADFRDTVLLVAFTYTSCPDICPLTTDRLLQVSERIPKELPVRFVLITLDPQRDTRGGC